MYQLKIVPKDNRDIIPWIYDFELINPTESKEKSQILENAIQKLKSDRSRLDSIRSM